MVDENPQIIDINPNHYLRVVFLTQVNNMGRKKKCSSCKYEKTFTNIANAGAYCPSCGEAW
ncbi:hypothetical protein HLRTI_000506 [Halorhabdus tiamatea SARL4B]|uniref:Uncharacterized protein n=1 Tax=Halorhabdus tiamatea SARL4B TaxID=1033806 RepID=U2E5I3_9EURY|nr:hypothetical protein HLRTI_000506 [Halorhabdus tiamatea SARL4B]